MQASVNYKATLFPALLFFSVNNVLSAPITSEQRQFFESEVRPILAENCYSCHSTKAKKIKGGRACIDIDVMTEQLSATEKKNHFPRNSVDISWNFPGNDHDISRTFPGKCLDSSRIFLRIFMDN